MISLTSYIISTKLFKQSGHIKTEVNVKARKARHQRVFAGAGILRLPALMVPSLLGFFGIWKDAGKKISWGLHFPKQQFDHSVLPGHKLFLRYSVFVAVLFTMGSLGSASASLTIAPSDIYSEVDSFWDIGSIMTNEDGYLTKINPQTAAGDRSSVRDRLSHTVAGGETISTIAAKYGLKSSTVLWANNIANSNSIKVNQELLIPPSDGVYHRVGKGQGIEKIAKTYQVSSETILKQNNITSGAILAPGDELFIPSGKPLVAQSPVRINRNTPARIASIGRENSVALDGTILNDTSDTPVEGKPFIFPTHGRITQRFHRGHYAIDVGNTDRPAVWAAGDGKVATVVSGCADVSYRCGNGYGNHVIVDHGNGLQTLYAHLMYPTAQVGDEVKQGQVIGKMGRSGRVHGITGIHLHFEVHKNGVKVVPSKYY